MVVVVEVGKPAEGLKELRQLTDKLTFPLPRKRKKAGALLPHIGREVSVVTGEEDEEEE